ncbi:hypothetical protein ElyMa_005999500 [Elysia marginata]|uniref:Uncharacterized protein n=1 Tax=Elysia marginata TaxID=1093978 RepID=A0AAV4GF86_9GAST|nr:hypothetical protein ElyMa_005999500 [Elysia marginata]
MSGMQVHDREHPWTTRISPLQRYRYTESKKWGAEVSTSVDGESQTRLLVTRDDGRKLAGRFKMTERTERQIET